MDFKNRGDSKKTIIISGDAKLTSYVSLEVIKNEYICEGASASELARKFNAPISMIQRLIQDNKLEELRAAHIKHGLATLQNVQIAQAEKLMNLENQFKKMRLVQIEKVLEDHLAYFSKHSHFYKIHPISGEILKDTNGIPMQIKLPNVSRELAELKESLSLSEGLKQMLSQIDDIINKPKDVEKLNKDVIDLNDFDDLFQKRSEE